MDGHSDSAEPEASAPAESSENADPPRPVRGLAWLVAPVLGGAAIGAAWSANYAASHRIDPATPIWFGGGVGLAVGAFVWAVFPYKGRPRKRPDSAERDHS